MGQKVCGPVCASRLVKANKAKGKAELRRRKAALMGVRELKPLAQETFNEYVRARDAQLPCISCGKPPPDLAGFHAGRDAGHYRSRGAADHLRFDERNCHAQCVECNQHKAGNIVAYRRGLIERIGIEAVEALESDNATHKWTREELIGIRDTYKQKLKELKACAT
jgi:hypothetical protein